MGVSGDTEAGSLGTLGLKGTGKLAGLDTAMGALGGLGGALEVLAEGLGVTRRAEL